MPILLSIGSNLGNRLQNISDVISLINDCGELYIEKTSPIYETEPYGNQNQNWFLNLALTLNIQHNGVFSPHNFFFLCKSIEHSLGRTIAPRWTERVIDIDIILIDDLIIDTSLLTIPHKEMHLRNFVLTPANDIAPNWIHPIYNKTINELLAICSDKSKIKLI